MTAGSDRTKTLGVGIIGAGMIVSRQAAAFHAHPQRARLVAVADLDPDLAEKARRTYGFESAHADHRELLARDDVDLVSICTRPDTHASLVRDAVEAGKHVLCEKPITRTLEEADRLIELTDAHTDLRVCCLYQWRADPAVRFVRRLVREGELGRPLMAGVQLRTRRPRSYYEGGGRRESWDLDGGGALMVFAIHQVDLLISMLGDPLEVSARMDTFCTPSQGEDTLVAWVRFRSGALATLRCSSCEHRDQFSVEVVGEEAGARVVGGGSKVLCRWQAHAADRVRERRLQARGRKEAPWRFDPGRLGVRGVQRLYRTLGRTWWPPGSWWHAPFVGEYLEAVHCGSEVPVTPREARRSLELVTAIYQSALVGGTVRLPLDDRCPFYTGVDPAKFRGHREDRP